MHAHYLRAHVSSTFLRDRVRITARASGPAVILSTRARAGGPQGDALEPSQMLVGEFSCRRGSHSLICAVQGLNSPVLM